MGIWNLFALASGVAVAWVGGRAFDLHDRRVRLLALAFFALTPGRLYLEADNRFEPVLVIGGTLALLLYFVLREWIFNLETSALPYHPLQVSFRVLAGAVGAIVPAVSVSFLVMLGIERLLSARAIKWSLWKIGLLGLFVGRGIIWSEVFFPQAMTLISGHTKLSHLLLPHPRFPLEAVRSWRFDNFELGEKFTNVTEASKYSSLGVALTLGLILLLWSLKGDGGDLAALPPSPERDWKGAKISVVILLMITGVGGVVLFTPLPLMWIHWLCALELSRQGVSWFARDAIGRAGPVG